MDNRYCFNLGHLFQKIAEEHSEQSAIESGHDKISYAELDCLSRQIALWILHQNIANGDLVCIFNDKSFTAYAAMLACLRLGITYSNIDTLSPGSRLQRILDIAKPKILFYAEKFSPKINEISSLSDNTFSLCNYTSTDFSTIKVESHQSMIHRETPGSHPAYLMFTSGSTGYPKGVAISHANILNFIAWGKAEIGINHSDRLSNINPMHFDNSVFDFYLSLFTGATLLPVQEELTKNPRQMIKYLSEHRCTVWFSVPSMLVYVLRMRALSREDLPDLQKIIFGGEGFPKNHLRSLVQILRDDVQLINVYGPTECTCICSKHIVVPDDLSSDELLPLGPMAPNFYGILVDEQLRAIHPGETGELVIGGPNVGLGYYHDPERTAGVFIQNPCHDNYRDIVYRSGDLARWVPEKNYFTFAGRKDNQIKRMGYRIELEEIESALCSIREIEEAACVYTGMQDTTRIFACIVSLEPEHILVDKLRCQIPTYMLPNQFVYYEVLPKNQNGKIDRVRLKQDMTEK